MYHLFEELYAVYSVFIGLPTCFTCVISTMSFSLVYSISKEQASGDPLRYTSSKSSNKRNDLCSQEIKILEVLELPICFFSFAIRRDLFFSL